MDKLLAIIEDRPEFHRGETEIDRSFKQEESWLSARAAQHLNDTELTCYGIGKDVMRFIADNVNEGSHTLETGAGCSTLIFALQKANHTAITPSLPEINRIKRYAEAHSISMDTVNFIPQSSERFLPNLESAELDLVLLDGKHAFPWPVLDWFFTADKLKRDGLMLIDDAQLRPVTMLVDFMKADNGWDLVRNFNGKTVVFKKTRAVVHDVAWHMQPYSASGLLSRIANRVKKLIKQ